MAAAAIALRAALIWRRRSRSLRLRASQTGHGGNVAGAICARATSARRATRERVGRKGSLDRHGTGLYTYRNGRPYTYGGRRAVMDATDKRHIAAAARAVQQAMRPVRIIPHRRQPAARRPVGAYRR